MGNVLRLEGEKALCLSCADLDHLEFLPRGDTALTRRAAQHSGMKVVVVQWSRARRRYERQGILATPESIHKAEKECLADADLRAWQRERASVCRDREDRAFVNRFAAAIRVQFPGCPAEEASAIARHACEKYSGRVGRSASAKELSEDAVRLAVVAHVRHVHTDYDDQLSRHQDRGLARAAIRDQLIAYLEKWEKRD
ncbi:MAG: DUF2293 domain-containing protein [Candidatus Riflebacteria bacterium]|nr:DUF2293 domain-containing protein [Candidatus Riflebacteria bacterium]